MSGRRFGYSATVVEDTIVTADGTRTEDMGGAYYGLVTLRALLPPVDEVVPVLVVGEDVAARVERDLARIQGLSPAGLTRCAAPNNKVKIEYHTDGSRDETLTGGVPPLDEAILEPWIDRLDAWLWNFVAGREVRLAAFERLKARFAGPIHVDVHSLCLEHPHGHGPRRFRPPAEWERWVAGARWVQMNAVEAGLLSLGRPEPPGSRVEAALAERIAGLGVETVLVTRGAEGASLYASGAERRDVPGWSTTSALDPTGCGDVFGAAWVALREGRGWRPERALAGAARAAGVAAGLRGTAGLYDALARAAGALEARDTDLAPERSPP